jgi:hypothetical protein
MATEYIAQLMDKTRDSTGQSLVNVAKGMLMFSRAGRLRAYDVNRGLPQVKS